MYVARVRLWNFRKFGSDESISSKLDRPDLVVDLKPGLNALIGPNDAGKTAVVDSIKLILGIHSTEWNWFVDDDFYGLTQDLRIECDIEGFELNEGKNFTEWSTFDDKGSQMLTVRINAHKQPKGIVGDLKAGSDEGTILPAEARSRLKSVYLKPLRDAQNELVARKNSRLSQILKGHSLFEDETTSGSVTLKGHVNTANTNLGGYFEIGQDGHTHITKLLDDPLRAFFDTSATGVIDVGDTHTIKSVLEKLSLRIGNHQNPGLGSLNRLFIAIELLLFLSNSNEDGSAHILLVEELEAHLHPQAQLKVAQYLQEKSELGKAQVIITTHSPILASKIKLQNLLVFTAEAPYCFSLDSQETTLKPTDYHFLERFLDSTKANLFFAKGVLIVEGDAENLLLPTIAAKLNKDLTKYGVSVVNVGSTAYMRFAKIFQRKEASSIPIKVAAIMDLDIKPKEYLTVDTNAKTEADFTPEELIRIRENRPQFIDDENIKGFVSTRWTLEYCIALSPNLRKLLYKAILLAQEETKQDIRTTDRVSPKTDDEINQEVSNYFQLHESSESTPEVVAFEIYQEHIVKPRLSKAIVAQHLASIIESSDATILNDAPIKYLVDAINHATSTNIESEVF